MYPIWGLILGGIIYTILGIFLIILTWLCFSKGGDDSGTGKDDGGQGSNGGLF